MIPAIAKDVTAKERNRRSTTITTDDVDRYFKKVNRSKKSVDEFLKRVGVTINKDGTVKVRPI